MVKLVEITRGDVVWVGFKLPNGDVHALYPSFRVGARRRAGQRMEATVK